VLVTGHQRLLGRGGCKASAESNLSASSEPALVLVRCPVTADA
jgi:hypothetical protein